MHRTGERRAAAGSGSLKGFAVLAVLALAGCGGGGGGGSKPSGANTSPPTPVPPPPPPSPYEINRAFRFDAAVFYPPALDFLATATSIGDINSDGRPDVVLATEGVYREEDRSRIFIYPQLPGGLLGAAFKSPFLDTYPWQPIGMTLGDLDGDGAPEIFVGHQEGLTVFKFHKDSQAITKVLPRTPTGSVPSRRWMSTTTAGSTSSLRRRPTVRSSTGATASVASAACATCPRHCAATTTSRPRT